MGLEVLLLFFVQYAIRQGFFQFHLIVSLHLHRPVMSMPPVKPVLTLSLVLHIIGEVIFLNHIPPWAFLMLFPLDAYLQDNPN